MKEGGINALPKALVTEYWVTVPMNTHVHGCMYTTIAFVLTEMPTRLNFVILLRPITACFNIMPMSKLFCKVCPFFSYKLVAHTAGHAAIHC